MGDSRVSRLQEIYAQAMARRRDALACVSPEELLALIRREGPEARRLEVLDHVMSCQACHREFELLRSLESAGARSGGKLQARSIGRRLAPLALAASLILAVGVGLLVRERNQRGDTTRGAGQGVVLLAPATDLPPAETITFAWRPVAGAERYRIELLNQAGSVVFTQLTPDTALTLTSRLLQPDTAYRWWVRDATPGAQRSSTLRPLRIRSR
jgi:hypothetical protein